MTSHPGRFLVLEGIDGSGKTTQQAALAAWLPDSGLLPPGAQVICTREPGGTALGQALRQLLLDPPDGIAPCPTAELLLYAADRAQHVEMVIKPALAAGHWVISDRFFGSTTAYQGYGRDLSLQPLAELERITTGGLVPDLTLWLDLPVADAMRRRGHRAPDRIEAGSEDFMQRVAQGFADQWILRPNWVRVDATGSPLRVAADCQRLVREHLSPPAP